MCYRRNAFLIPTGGKPHLHFVITDPVEGKILVVGITSYPIDPKFVLERGDHPYITHTSYINYSKAQTLTADVVARCLKKGIYQREQDARSKIINKISEGILESDDTPPRIRQFFKFYEKL